VSKSLTAAGAVLLARQGRLDLDRPVGSSLPGWQTRPAGAATGRQLAGHLGGIRHYQDDEGVSTEQYEDVMDALEIFATDSLVGQPGTDYEYSTYGYVLLSALIQQAAGVPFLEWMDGHIIDPLGMTATGPDMAVAIVADRAAFYEIVGGRLRPAPFTDNSYKWAGGGFLSSPGDLVRFGNGLLGGTLLDSAGVALLFTSQKTASGEPTGYGMGFRPDTGRDGRRVVHHGGSSEGARAFLMLYPDDGVVIAMAANRATAPLFEEEAATFAHIFLDHGEGVDGALDDSLTGAWRASGSLGRDTVQGRLRLFPKGQERGILEWSGTEAPIHIVAVDRHGDEMLLIGVGPHGVMNAWLVPVEAGWDGTWEYLGRRGALRLGAAVQQ
jgi:CubicO group peptidase (beta-lactamase class C family)